jgi:hypothetical protein
VVTAAWLAAVAVSALIPRFAVWSVSGAWLATVGAAISVALHPASVYPWELPGDQTGVYRFALVGGFIAMVAALTRTDRSSTVERWGVLAGVVAMLAVTEIFDVIRGGRPIVVQAPWWVSLDQYGPATLMVAGLVVWALRRSTALLWAGLILFVPLPILWVWAYAPAATAVYFRSVLDPAGNATELYVFHASSAWPLEQPALAAFGRRDGLFGAAILAGVLLAAVAVAARHRRDPARDGRAALASIGTVSLGLASGMGLFALVTWAYQGNGVPRDVVAAAVPVVAAGVAMLVPAWLGRALLASAAITIAVIGYTAGVVVPQSYVVTVALLLTVAAACLRVGVQGPTVRTGGRVAIATAVVAVATLAGLGAVYDVTAIGVGDLLWRVYGGDPMPLYAAAAVALIPTLIWAPVVVLRSATGWIAALVATAAALVWLSIEVGFAAVDASTFIAAIASCAALLGIARLATRPIRRRTAV